MKGYLISDLHIDHIGNGNPTEAKMLRYLERFLEPADVLFIAGDIADSGHVFAKCINALSTLYPRVIYCDGNHDYTVHPMSTETTKDKLERISKLIHAQNQFKLDGTFVELNEQFKIGGCMGAYDMSYSNKHFGFSFDAMMEKWKKWYDGKFWKLDYSYAEFLTEQNTKLNALIDEHQCNILMTHIGPVAYKIPPHFHNEYTGFFYFDGAEMLSRMPENSYWFYGHTHDKHIFDYETVKVMCNPVGYPTEKIKGSEFKKSDFLIDLG